ncbi:MAG: hypothetical protein M1837_000683 [Sclerophora amabilis]|nr:MAG: hypothetical protein M1837_000683 [Sclerophora amabilis]
MPRVVNPPRANGKSDSKSAAAAAASPFKSPIKIPLNDDVQEKAARLQSRQALHDLQLNQLKAAASPVRQLNNFNRAASNSPKTPMGSSGAKSRENEGEGLMVVGGTAMTPMKRKINATNSWNFALIDYFYDMSLLKEGDGVNFQKASCTLDGCVKIYTSRVDSVATETGKLLSGLADSGNKKRKGGEEDGEDGEEEEEEGEDGVKRRVKKRAQRSSEATLAPSFAPLQVKKFELEFSVDPLFKKASADFDEGGAKGLLLNHLTIDSHGRIVFDSSDDVADASAEGDPRRRKSSELSKAPEEEDEEEDRDAAAEPDDGINDGGEEDCEIDIGSLGAKFFPNLDILDNQDICPSLKTFDLGDPSGSLDIPFLKANDDPKPAGDEAGGIGEKSGIILDDDNPAGFDDDDGEIGGFDLPPETGFGEGGEIWARDAAIEPQNRVHDGGLDGGEVEGLEGGNYDAESGDYVVSLDQRRGKTEGSHEDILRYFDQALQKNWAGPEHWRIRRIKDIAKQSTPTSAKPRKEKEPFEIDFSSPLDPSLAALIYTPASSNSVISLPKSQWKSKTRNLLPDDKHFNSRQLLRLFLKPKVRMASRRGGFPGSSLGVQQSSQRDEDLPESEMDEAFWARKEALNGNVQEDEAVQGDYDANFFQDDGLAFPGGMMDDDDDEFADAREAFSPGIEGEVGAAGSLGIDGALVGGTQDGAFGTQLVTQSRRLRPEYVQYARVAKKVDVRRLKEELWKGMGIEDRVEEAQQKPPPPPQSPSKPPTEPVPKTEDGTLKFTTVMNNLQAVYPKQAMADISTSYCFICLLHLANEKGLQIANQEGLMELNIRRDFTAEITEGG